MTSKSSSWADRSTHVRAFHGAGFFTRQRELTRRRLWPCALTFLGYLLYHVIGTVTILNTILQNASSGYLSAAEKTASLTGAMTNLFGENSFSAYMITLPIAVILAIEGFAWLDNRQEVDFYESQPVPRSQRFRDICVNSLLFYAFSYLLTAEAGLLIAGAMGAVTRAVLIEALLQCLRSTAFFLAIYGLGVLSTMLTGNVVVAGLAFLVLLLYEEVFKLILRGYCNEFLATWSGRAQGFLVVNIFDPFYHYRYGIRAEAPLRLLALALLYFLLAYICYRLRRNECAGTAVVFAPVRTVVRIALALITGLFAGLLLASIQHNPALSILWLVLFAVIAACIMQIIYEYDFKALFHRPLEIAAAAALALLVFLGFSFDLMGYDRFVPDPAKVADAALVCTDDDYYSQHFDEKGNYIAAVDYGDRHMHLENVEDVIALASYGQEYTRQSSALHGEEGTIDLDPALSGGKVLDNNEMTYQFTVLYRMKNGTTISRNFRLPTSIDPAMMEAVVGTPRYREGTFQIYQDQVLRQASDACLMNYTNAKDYTSTKMTKKAYEEVRAAYIRDLELFSYRFARANQPVGRIEIEYDERRPLPSGMEDVNLENLSMGLPVYADFTNTIAVLQEYDLWIEPLDKDRLRRIADLPAEERTHQEQDFLDSINDYILTGPFH